MPLFTHRKVADLLFRFEITLLNVISQVKVKGQRKLQVPLDTVYKLWPNRNYPDAFNAKRRTGHDMHLKFKLAVEKILTNDRQ